LRKIANTQQELAISTYWLGLSFMWNSIHPILLPVLLLSFTEHAKNTAYGMLTFVGLVIALLVQPLSGALSDRTHHWLGRRRPWILLGSALNIGCLVMMVTARSLWVVGAAYVLLQFCSNLAHGPAQGLIPDLVPPTRRGIAAGLKNAFDMGGIILAATISGRVMGATTPRAGLMGILIIGVMVTATAITVKGARERSTAELETPMDQATLADQSLRALLTVDLSKHRDYGRLLLSRFFVLLGSFAVQSFALFYFRDILEIASPARAVGQMMAIIGISIVVTAYPAGALSERWGRKRLAMVACALAATGMGLLVVLRSPAALGGLGAMIGVGMGIFASVNWAWATDLVPQAEAGKYLGFSNLATAGSAAVARLLGPFVDLLNRWTPSAGYSMVFVLATLGALAGLLITLSIHDSRHPDPPCIARLRLRLLQITSRPN
jgi:Na+/melibiose symporter-like transporter